MKNSWISECAYMYKWEDSTGHISILLNKWASYQILDPWGERCFCVSLMKSLLERTELWVHVTLSDSSRRVAWGSPCVKLQEDSCSVSSSTACHWGKPGRDHLSCHLVVQEQDGLLGNNERGWVLGVIPVKAGEFHKQEIDTNKPGCTYNSYTRACNCTIHNNQTPGSA